MMLVEGCGNWSQVDPVKGKHCFNCANRNGYPQRAQPSRDCTNFWKLDSAPGGFKRAFGILANPETATNDNDAGTKP